MHARFPLTVTSSPDRETSRVDLRIVQDFLWRRWISILSTAGIVCAISLIILISLTPRYTATVQVLLDPQKNKAMGADAVLPELSLDSGAVDSQISVIRSIGMLRRVVEKMQLNHDVEFAGTSSGGLRGLIASWWSDASELNSKATVKASDGLPADVLRAISRLRDALQVARVQRTYVLQISVTSESAIKAAALANAVADTYVVDQLDARYEAAKRASSWLAERMEGLREQVRRSEEAVVKFRREHNLLQTSTDAKLTINEQQLSELNGKLVAARADTAEKRAKYEQAREVQNSGGNLQAIPDVVRSVVISQLRAQQAQAAGKVAELASRYNDKHPLVINARAELRDIDRSIANEVDRIVNNLKNDYEVAEARQESLQKSLDELSGASGLNNEVGIRLRELERINAANKTLFENFLSRTKISQEQSTFAEREARIISPATVPRSPSFPRKTLLMSLAVVVGSLIGIGGSIGLDMLNSGFSSPREIEERLGIPVLASIPLLRSVDLTVNGQSIDPARFSAMKPLSRYSEAIRALRMGIRMADVDAPARVVLVTSTMPSEGKTTTSLCLAISAKMANEKVLLIDGDLRHPAATKTLGLEGRPGLVDVLTSAVRADQAIFSKDGFSVIPTGSRTQTPTDLLGSERMRLLIGKLREMYDYIVIDTPPVGPVIDAKVALQLADKIVYVVRWRETSREVVSQAISSLNADRKLAGIALAMVDESKAPRYGAYAHYGNYHYGKYYQG